MDTTLTPQVAEPTSSVSRKRFRLDVDPKTLILLPETTYDGRHYPPLYVSISLLGIQDDLSSDSLKTAGRVMGLDLKNTNKDRFGREFIGNLERLQATLLANMLSATQLDIRRRIDLVLLLRAGLAGGVVYDGTKNRLSSDECGLALEQVFYNRGQIIGEHLDASFKGTQEQLILNTNHRFVNSHGEVGTTEDSGLRPNQLLYDSYPLEYRVEGGWKDCVMSFDGADQFGIPTKKGNDIDFQYPRPGSSARMLLGGWAIRETDRPWLICYGVPGSRGSIMGLRYAKIADNI